MIQKGNENKSETNLVKRYDQQISELLQKLTEASLLKDIFTTKDLLEEILVMVFPFIKNNNNKWFEYNMRKLERCLNPLYQYIDRQPPLLGYRKGKYFPKNLIRNIGWAHKHENLIRINLYTELKKANILFKIAEEEEGDLMG